VAIEERAIRTASGNAIASDFTVWAAGIRCQSVLKEIGGLETNRINQLVVKQTLQATRDDDIFALGDCAACAWTEGRFVPPRAQAAHQQASHVFASIRRRLSGEAPKDFRYRDFGSLVSLGTYESVGTLMGFVTGGSIRLEGLLAKLFYVSLYRMHILALHGFWRMALDTLARMIRSQTEPKVKLH
jgi:NADH dehydrogenase